MKHSLRLGPCKCSDGHCTRSDQELTRHPLCDNRQNQLQSYVLFHCLGRFRVYIAKTSKFMANARNPPTKGNDGALKPVPYLFMVALLVSGED